MASRQLGMVQFVDVSHRGFFAENALSLGIYFNIVPGKSLASDRIHVLARIYNQSRLSRDVPPYARDIAEALELLAWKTLERRARDGR